MLKFFVCFKQLQLSSADHVGIGANKCWTTFTLIEITPLQKKERMDLYNWKRLMATLAGS